MATIPVSPLLLAFPFVKLRYFLAYSYLYFPDRSLSEGVTLLAHWGTWSNGVLSPPVCLVSGKNTNSGYLRSVLLGAEKNGEGNKNNFFFSSLSYLHSNIWMNIFTHIFIRIYRPHLTWLSLNTTSFIHESIYQSFMDSSFRFSRCSALRVQRWLLYLKST